MEVVVLCGGLGTRLSEETQVKPKPMVEIGGKPMLWHIMKRYSKYGFNDFIIALGVKSSVIKEYFYNYEYHNDNFSIDLSNGRITYHDTNNKEDWKVTLVDTGLNTLKGGRIKRIEPYLDSKINMVTYGDGVADINVKKLVEFHKSHGKTITITGVYPPARFGELIEENGIVRLFQEKPQASQGVINGGFMVFNKELLNYLTENENCDFERGPLEKLAKNGEVMVYKHDGSWECMDHGRDVVYLNKLWNEGKAFWKVW